MGLPWGKIILIRTNSLVSVVGYSRKPSAPKSKGIDQNSHVGYDSGRRVAWLPDKRLVQESSGSATTRSGRVMYSTQTSA